MDPRTGGINIFLMAVDLYHRYSKEVERANRDIYGDFNWKNTVQALKYPSADAATLLYASFQDNELKIRAIY